MRDNYLWGHGRALAAIHGANELARLRNGVTFNGTFAAINSLCPIALEEELDSDFIHGMLRAVMHMNAIEKTLSDPRHFSIIWQEEWRKLLIRVTCKGEIYGNADRND